MEDEYLKVGDVAARLHVSRQAVYNWIAEGRLEAVRVGKSVRVPVSALLRFMQPVKPGERIEDDEPGKFVPALAAA